MEVDQFKYSFEMKLDNGKRRELPSKIGACLSIMIYLLIALFVIQKIETMVQRHKVFMRDTNLRTYFHEDYSFGSE